MLSRKCFGSTGRSPMMVGSSRLPLTEKREGDLAIAGLLRLRHVLVVEGVVGRDLLDGIEREDHVLGRDGLAVVEARALAQLDGRGGEVVRVGSPTRRRGRRMPRPRRDSASAACRRSAPNPTAGLPLTGNWLSESKVPMAQRRTRPPFGCVRIDPAEVREIGPVLGSADQGQRMVLREVVRG